MASDWRATTLGDFLELKRGYDLPHTQRRHGSFPIISSSGTSGLHDLCKVRGPGVVTGRYGTIGEVFFVPKDFWPLNTTLYVCDFKGSDPRFVSYFLRTLNFQAYSDKAAVPGINRNHLHQAEVIVPEPEEQQRIAAVLAALDDRIDHNRALAANLETIARALFKSWFVDFDPVRAKAAGEAPPGLAPDLAALFPDRLNDGELGEIPQGWAASTLAEVGSLNPESWTGRKHPEQIEYVDLANVKAGQIENRAVYSWDESPSRARRVLRSGDTIVGTVRPGNRSFALITEDGLTGSTGFAALRPKLDHQREFLYLAATSVEAIDRLTHLADGAAYPAVRPDVVAEAEAVIPDDQVLRSFSSIVAPMLDRVAVARSEHDGLAKIRDLLLPRLISGKLRVEEAERTLEVA